MQQLDAERSKIKVVLLGDSITHGWETAGKDVYAELFAEYPVLNLAFSGDHTGHTLWILEQDNLWKDLDAQLVVIMIGTNNIGWKKQPANETADAIKLVVRRVKERLPEAKILLYAVFPRGADANAVHRPMIDQINQEIVKLADNQTVFFENINASFLNPDGTIPPVLMPDFLHPLKTGYLIWADSIKPYLKRFCK